MTSFYFHNSRHVSSNLTLPHRRSQGSVEGCAFARSEFTSFRPATATISQEGFALETLPVLGREFEFVEELVRKLALETADDVLSKYREEFESAAGRGLAKGYFHSLQSGPSLTVHFHRWL